ncbi:PREDICTED: protein FAM219A isoform X3 [Chinchilla lanigera]|uniref:protein FAM219A isoform X3 n=1 Tax=Chinchilla lanigera TaxID=34839 RepID=UPI00038EA5FB|nr:PREDICTED: protein FAM219A isoform X3 [Chinchilla lanigera]
MTREGALAGREKRGRMRKDPATASISDGDCDAREGESVAMNYKPSPLQVKLGQSPADPRLLYVQTVTEDVAHEENPQHKAHRKECDPCRPRHPQTCSAIPPLQPSPSSGRQCGLGGSLLPVFPAEKQRELARKGSLKNGSMGSPVNQQPKKNNVMARTRLVVPNKGYSSLDQSPDEKPLVALDTDSDDDFDMSRYSSSGYSSAEQINQDLNIQLLKDGYRLDEIPDDEDLDLIPPKSVNPTCMCCQATSSTACHIQ